MQNKKFPVAANFMTVVLLVMIYLIYVYRAQYAGNNQIILAGTCILAVLFIVAVAFYVMHVKKITEDTIFLLLFAALCIRVFYVVLMKSHIYQNDAGTLSPGSSGHLGYIYYILSENKLPDFDPRELNQFYHPPLHHIISALWIKLNMLFGMKMENVGESLQILSLFYSTITLIFLNKIGIRLKISCVGRFIALGFIAFLPYNIMMAGNINNDVLMTLLVIMALYFALKWYQEPTIKNILLIAVTIGGSMMTKLSGGLIAPAVAAIMLIKVWQERKSWKKYVKQFVVFGVVVFPIGLWFPIKNLILYGVPITYVPFLGTDSEQFIGHFTGLQRWFGIEGQFNPLYINWNNYLPDVSYNIPISLVKFTVFGEGYYYLHNETVKKLGIWIFYITFAVLVLAVIFTIIWLFQRKAKLYEKIGMALAAGVIFASYVKFCYSYPHVCTMHVRYVMVPLYLGFLCMGAAISNMQGKRGIKAIKISFLGLTVLYSLISILLMVNLQMLF